jgi:hypothetical protein
MNKEKEKYRYLGKGANLNKIPIGWKATVLQMLEELDKNNRPFLVPLKVMNFMYDKGLFKSYFERFRITELKELYAKLYISRIIETKVSKPNTISKAARNILTLDFFKAIVDNTCENCGSVKNVKHSVARINPKRIENYCEDCRTKFNYIEKLSLTIKKEIPKVDLKTETKQVEAKVVKTKAKVKRAKNIKKDGNS